MAGMPFYVTHVVYSFGMSLFSSVGAVEDAVVVEGDIVGGVGLVDSCVGSVVSVGEVVLVGKMGMPMVGSYVGGTVVVVVVVVVVKNVPFAVAAALALSNRPSPLHQP